MISDRNPNITPTQIESEEHPNDLRDQIRVLTEGIRTLTSVLITPSECPDGIKRIEQLQSTWRLEDTGFSSLFNACTQMQNTLHLTSLEADKNFEECQRVREIASAAKLEEEKMKKIVFTLQKEKLELQEQNLILVNEIEDHKKERKLIARSVRNFVETTYQRIREIASTTKLEGEKMRKEILALQKDKIELQKKNRIRTNEDIDQKKYQRGIPRSIQIFMDTGYEEQKVALNSSILASDAPDLLYSNNSSISTSSTLVILRERRQRAKEAALLLLRNMRKKNEEGNIYASERKNKV